MAGVHLGRAYVFLVYFHSFYFNVKCDEYSMSAIGCFKLPSSGLFTHF